MKYSEETREKICDYLKAGYKRTEACLLADITEETFYQWMKSVPEEGLPERLMQRNRPKGKAPEWEAERSAARAEFSESIKKAELHNKGRAMVNIQNDKSWQSDAWWLERRYPDQFGAKQKIEHSGKLSMTEWLKQNDGLGPVPGADKE